ncbi:MAG: dipeptidase [Kangiellaceae bacterium]|jgi:membrane dipeptidase|nr:dipeptidase [Kangiellaceae bacterium]
MKIINTFAYTVIASTFVLAISGCDSTPKERAKQLSQKLIITDTHVDVPYRLERQTDDVSQATAQGDFDFPRAKSGGLDAPFMSIYVPAKLEAEGGSKQLADKLIDGVEAIVAKSPDKFALALSWNDIEKNFSEGKISLPMGMENGSPIEHDLNNLTHFYSRGIRYITLAHSLSNHISDSSYDDNRPAGGLTDFGKDVVKEMNRLGIMVDVSHISDDAFTDVMKISQVPVIASHSSARHFTPGFERNMSDEMIKQLAKNGGVIFINYGSSFISKDYQDWSNEYRAARSNFIKQKKLNGDSRTVEEFDQYYLSEYPKKYATLDQVLDHFDHVKELVGVDHLGIGSDYDGVGDSLPTGLKDVSSYPNLIEGLLNRGYTEQDIEKILSGNLKRVWLAVEKFSQQN